MKISKVFSTISSTIGLVLIGGSTVLASQGFVDGSTVNIRQEASIHSEVLGKVYAGEVLSILDVTEDWFKVSFGESEGFISADYFEIETTEAIVINDGVQIYDAPNELFGQALSLIQKGSNVVVTGKLEGWYEVNYGSEEVGYIQQEHLDGSLVNDMSITYLDSEGEVVEEEIYGITKAPSGLNLREYPTTESEILAIIPQNTRVDVEFTDNEEWVKVTLDDGQTGFISAEFVDIHTVNNSGENGTALGLEVIEYAKQFIGTPYVWGGTNLNSGVDCSGYVFSVMKNFGITLHRSSYHMVDNGVPVEKSNLQAGDLVFFNAGGSGGISHVGLALGDGKYIHASSGASNGVVISDLSSSYSMNSYVTARRVL